MIHYHGLPITPDTAAHSVLHCGHAFVSFAHPQQICLAVECCQTFAVDNGAFSAWKSGKPITDWNPYYEFIKDVMQYPGFDFAVIPDVIDGDEQANDDLVAQWPWGDWDKHVGAPVWHLHESMTRLFRLASGFPRICIGSSGEYAVIGSKKWWVRMDEAMNILTKLGRPITKIHGLRMLDPEIFTRFPFASADSTNIGRNVGIDSRWANSAYPPPTKAARAAVMRSRIEAYNSPSSYNSNRLIGVQESMF
jgi:hypothetical protein